MERRKRRKFTPEYKAEVVKLVQTGGKSVGQVSSVIGGLLFLVAIIDLFSRKVVGWSLGDRLRRASHTESCPRCSRARPVPCKPRSLQRSGVSSAPWWADGRRLRRR